MRPLLLAASDFHLRNDGIYLFSSKPFICGDMEFAINQICGLLELEKPYGFVIAGDFFHNKHVSSGDINLAVKLLRTAKTYCDTIFYVQGQHDRFDPQFISVLEETSIHLHKKKVEFLGKTIIGLDYVPDNLHIELDGLPEADIFVTHQTWKTRPSEIFGKILVSDLCRKYPLTICGDIHSHWVANALTNSLIEPQQGVQYKFKRTFISPGSICLQKFDAKESFGVFLVYDDLSVASIRLKSRPIKILTAYSDDDIRRIKEEIVPEILKEASELPEIVSQPILVIKSYEFLSSILDLAQFMEGKGFVFFSQKKFETQNPNIDRRSMTISTIIDEVFESNVFKDVVIDLFKAAKQGYLEKRIEELVEKLKKEIDETIDKKRIAEK